MKHIFCKSKPKNPTFGTKIPELETAIDTFVSKANTISFEEQNLLKKIKEFAK